MKYRAKYSYFIMKWKNGLRNSSFRNISIRENGDFYYNGLLWGYVRDGEYFIIDYDEYRLLHSLGRKHRKFMHIIEQTLTDIFRDHFKKIYGMVYIWVRTLQENDVSFVMYVGGESLVIDPNNNEFLAKFGPKANDILIVLQKFPRFIHYANLPKDKFDQALMLNDEERNIFSTVY